jgi:hypothetical protein
MFQLHTNAAFDIWPCVFQELVFISPVLIVTNKFLFQQISFQCTLKLKVTQYFYLFQTL